jgi:hypothetical protein
MKSREALDRDLKEVVFTVAVTAAFTLGFYSLLLASANKGKALPLTTFGVVRTATAADTEKIVLALGALAEHELVFVVLDTSTAGIDPRPVNAASPSPGPTGFRLRPHRHAKPGRALPGCFGGQGGWRHCARDRRDQRGAPSQRIPAGLGYDILM